MHVRKVEGIGRAYAGSLAKAGVRSARSLLKAGADRSGRQTLAKQAGVSEARILEWVNRVDLMRVKGVGEEYSDLLEQAGVDTVKELAARNPTNLHAALVNANAKKGLVRRLPSQSMVKGWVSRAKRLRPVITY